MSLNVFPKFFFDLSDVVLQCFALMLGTQTKPHLPLKLKARHNDVFA